MHDDVYYVKSHKQPRDGRDKICLQCSPNIRGLGKPVSDRATKTCSALGDVIITNGPNATQATDNQAAIS